MIDDIAYVLFSHDRIDRTVERLARRIDRDFAVPGESADSGGDENLTLLGVLEGGRIFLEDLSARLETPHRVDFLKAASYGAGDRSSGNVRIVRTPGPDLRGKRVLVVDDIYDTGRTLARIVEHVRGLGPASLDVCVLLSKPAARVEDVAVRYVGLETPNVFVVGYGLDFNQRYRELPFIGVLKPSLAKTAATAKNTA